MTFSVSGRLLWSRKTLEESFCGKTAATFRSNRSGWPRPSSSHFSHPSCTPGDGTNTYWELSDCVCTAQSADVMGLL